MDKSWNSDIAAAGQEAVDHLTAGYNWAESVLLAVCKAKGRDYDLIPRIASAFGGGMGRQGETCGALVGGVMLMGLFHGRDSVDECEAKEAVHARAGELVRRVAAANGAVRCRDLLGIDVSTPEGVQEYYARNLHALKCSPAVRNVVGVVMEMLD